MTTKLKHLILISYFCPELFCEQPPKKWQCHLAKSVCNPKKFSSFPNVWQLWMPLRMIHITIVFLKASSGPWCPVCKHLDSFCFPFIHLHFSFWDQTVGSEKFIGLLSKFLLGCWGFSLIIPGEARDKEVICVSFYCASNHVNLSDSIWHTVKIVSIRLADHW